MILTISAYMLGMIVPDLETISLSGIIVGGAFLGSWTSSMLAINGKRKTNSSIA